MTNAIDASAGGEAPRVVVSTSWDADAATARITVTDNGVGIEESELASIFQIFSSSKGSRGTGLGLPVSRKIVVEHGGKISVTSQVGQGSRFVIELPLKRADAKAAGEGMVPPPEEGPD